jgi:hypothetical protein
MRKGSLEQGDLLRFLFGGKMLQAKKPDQSEFCFSDKK